MRKKENFKIQNEKDERKIPKKIDTERIINKIFK